MKIKEFKSDFKRGYNDGVVRGMTLSITEKIFIVVVGVICVIATYALIYM